MDNIDDIKTKISETVGPVTSAVSDTTFNAARGAVVASRKVDDEGTPLRSGVRAVRLAWNGAVGSLHGATAGATDGVAGFATLARARLSPLEPWAAHADELRKSRPELLVAAVAAPVALLSAALGRGKLAAARNGFACAAAAGSAVLAAKFWEK